MNKLLFITAFPPNQKTGGQTFTLNAIKELSRKYMIDLIFFSYPDHICEVEKGNNISSITEIPIKSYNFIKKFWIHPIFTRRFNKKILDDINAIASNYDILYFDFSQVALFSLYINHPHKILRMHDVLYQKFCRKNKLLKKWIMHTEKNIIDSFSKVFVPSVKDVELVRAVYKTDVFYTNEYLKLVTFNEEIEQKRQLIFYGYWKRIENLNGLIWFIEKVLPIIETNLKILVIGGGLSNDVKEKYLDYNKIEYLGFVEKPLDIILQSSAVIVPLFQGAGIKVKVIDSFTVGTPVIGTDLAFEGLPFISGLSYCANNENDFARYINQFKPLSYEEKIYKAKKFDSVYNKHHLLEQILR